MPPASKQHAQPHITPRGKLLCAYPYHTSCFAKLGWHFNRYCGVRRPAYALHHGTITNPARWPLPRSDSEKSPVRLVRQSHSGCRRLRPAVGLGKAGEVGGVGGQVRAGRRRSGGDVAGDAKAGHGGGGVVLGAAGRVGWPASGAVVAPVGSGRWPDCGRRSGLCPVPGVAAWAWCWLWVQAVRWGAALVEQGGAHAPAAASQASGSKRASAGSGAAHRANCSISEPRMAVCRS